METLNHYEFLGVPTSATASEIRVAYRRLAMRYHPDMNASPEAVARFNALCEAYRCLSDPDARAAYDLQLAARVDPAISVEVAPEEVIQPPEEEEDNSSPPIPPNTTQQCQSLPPPPRYRHPHPQRPHPHPHPLLFLFLISFHH